MQQKTKQERNITPVNSLEQLKQMATSNELKDILKNYIEFEKIPSVRTVWVEYFLDIKKNQVNKK